MENQLRRRLPGGGSTPAHWETSQDGDLSLGALGLHTYLMSLPDKWDISSERIARARKEGRDAIRKWMRELEAKRLMAIERHRDEFGRIRTFTTVWAIPEPAFPQVTPGTDSQAPAIPAGHTGDGSTGAGETGTRSDRRPVDQAPKSSSSTDLTPDSSSPLSSEPVPPSSGVRDEQAEPEKSGSGDESPIDDPTQFVGAGLGVDAFTRPSPHPRVVPEPPSAACEAVLAGLDWHTWPQPTKTNESRLHGPVQGALNAGWTVGPLTAYANAAIRRATINPGTYLINALNPGELGRPPSGRNLNHRPSSPSTPNPEGWTPADPETAARLKQEAIKQASKGKGKHRDVKAPLIPWRTGKRPEPSTGETEHLVHV